AVSRTRQDIQSWNTALRMAQSEDAKNYKLQLLFDEISNDALLTSQIQNRKQQLFTSSFSLKKPNGEVDEEQTTKLKNSPIFRQLTMAILDSLYYGYSLVELRLEANTKGELVPVVTTLPRTNVVPQKGLFYKDYTQDKTTAYREMPEFGTWILEFNSNELGLLNKAVSHVLFKRFAQSCWSELCEIYGIPPRVLKTNTQDGTMLRRGEQMMRDMGSAAWFIIDSTENFEWAKGVATNGDVYNNLIGLCNNEISMLISGAVIGQDTKNGSKGKEQSSQDMLWQLVQSDMEQAEQYWNDTIIPGLINIGFLTGELNYEFDPQEDTQQLYERAIGFLGTGNYAITPDYILKKFGLEVVEKTQPTPSTQKLNLDGDFFV
ncbi:phage portal protein family protein, partial [Flavobacterium psychrophilum]